MTMPSEGEIRSRINSIQSTQKITSAMYMISSTKMRQAKEELDKTRPFFELQETEIKRIFQSVPDAHSRYFYPESGRKAAETYAYLVITADKGLAGAYNHNVLKMAEQQISKHEHVQLYVVGAYGRHFFEKKNIPIARSFLYTAQNPTVRRAREICSILLEQYDTGKVDEIRVIYSDMQSELISDVKMVKLLPFERYNFATRDDEMTVERFEFVPSVEKVLDNVMASYVSGFVYGALVDSFSAEQNARMAAMDSANRNAEELLADLRLKYNRMRQASITQEITEVSAGSRARRKRQDPARKEENNEGGTE